MIFVIAEHKDKKLKPITSYLRACRQRRSRDFNRPGRAVGLGAGVEALAGELKAKRIDRVIIADHPELAEYTPDSYVGVLKSIIEQEKPFVVLVGHTTQGMDFAPRLAVSMRHPLIAGCVEYEKRVDRLILTRQRFNAKVNMKTPVP